MHIEETVTNPLPRWVRDPLLLLLDARQARRIWVARLLAWAHYHVYAPDTVAEAASWFLHHPVAPQAILVGELDPSEQELTQLLFRQYVVQGGRQIPVIALVDASVDGTSSRSEPSFSPEPDARQGLDLLEVLWQDVSRLV